MTVFFFMAEKSSGEAIKTKRLSKEKIKTQLIDSLVCGEHDETQDLNKQADEVEKCEQAAVINMKI